MAWLDQVGAGLGRVRNALLPVPEEVASQLDPQTIEALRKQAMLQLGLGMMSAGSKRQGLGTAALYGLDQAQQGLGAGLNQAWLGSRARREDDRLNVQERNYDAQIARMEALDKRAQDWRAEDQTYRSTRDAADDEFKKAQLRVSAGDRAADNARQEAALALQRSNLGLSAAEAQLQAKQAESRGKLLQEMGKVPRGGNDWMRLHDVYVGLGGQALISRSSGNDYGYSAEGGGDAVAAAIKEIAANKEAAAGRSGGSPAQATPPPFAPQPSSQDSMRPFAAKAGDAAAVGINGLGRGADSLAHGAIRMRNGLVLGTVDALSPKVPGGIAPVVSQPGQAAGFGQYQVIRPDIVDPIVRARLGLPPL